MPSYEIIQPFLSSYIWTFDSPFLTLLDNRSRVGGCQTAAAWRIRSHQPGSGGARKDDHAINFDIRTQWATICWSKKKLIKSTVLSTLTTKQYPSSLWLGTGGATKRGEFSEKLLLAFDPPPPSLWKIVLQIFLKTSDKTYANVQNLQHKFLDWKWPPPSPI